jgi:TPR repeat protein
VVDAQDITRSSSCRCTRCATDLAVLAPAARFCPQCGLRLSEQRPPVPLRIDRIDRMPSSVLLGYANAMFRLGFHYEVRHNDDEAIRCYGKASRLGNEPAKTRLLDVPLAKVMENQAPGGTPLA